MPIHFLWGEEDYLIERSITKIKNTVLKGDINELNYRVVNTPSFAVFSELLRTNATMFGEMVIVIKCQNYFLNTKNKIELDDKQIKELTQAINNVSDKVHFILVCQTPRGEKKKPDSRKKLYKELAKVAKIENYPEYKSYELNKLTPILEQMANEIGITIQSKESALLVQTTGTSLRSLSIQLEKLKLLAHPETKITSQMIEKIASSTIDAFSITDLIIEKDYPKALDLISNLLQKEHYLPSLALIQNSITKLLILKIYSPKLSNFDLAVKTGMHEFIVQKTLQKISNVSLRELARLKINLAEIDYMLKIGTLKDPLLAYELAFFSEKIGEKIC